MIGHLIIWTKYEFTSLELFCLPLRNFFHRFFFSLCFISFYITHIHEYWRRCIKCKLWKSSSCRTFPSVNQAQFESQIRRFILLTSNHESDDSYGEKKNISQEKRSYCFQISANYFVFFVFELKHLMPLLIQLNHWQYHFSWISSYHTVYTIYVITYLSMAWKYHVIRELHIYPEHDVTNSFTKFYTNFIVSIIFNRKIKSFWNFFNKNHATHSSSKSECPDFIKRYLHDLF